MLTDFRIISLSSVIIFLIACGQPETPSTKTDPVETKSEPVVEAIKPLNAGCLVDVDWCFPSCADPSGAWKFSTDGTFNYSTTAFGGMSTWGNWSDVGDGRFELRYTRSTESTLPPNQIIRLNDCKTLLVGSTTYRAN